MSVRNDYYKILADTLIKNFNKRQMEACYCATASEAREKALSLPASGTTVSFGGSMTLEETGVLAALRERTDIRLIDRAQAKTPEETKRMYHEALSCDYYFMSANALTQNGELVNIDGNGNRVAALIYGPENVIVIAGLNKVVRDVEEGISRVHNTATPLNCIRLNKKTPCAVTGCCGDCLSPDCICNQVVVTRRSGIPGRIKIILVGEELGY